ncbi:nucleotidyltransferase family protein [Aquipuribacter sp. MA13-6]|uniref:nucleotidyltransferase family protein n=1 Tax=unclassified Aquipuribacter TaxID=2635084 RepID=UPI003EEC4512
MFGSAARGDTRDDSDLGLLVDLAPGSGDELLRVSGLAEELSELPGVRVDVVAAPLLRDEVSATALADAVAVRAVPTQTASKTSGPRSPAASLTATTSILLCSARWRTTRSCGTWR